MNVSDWREIELHHASDGPATTVGAEFDTVIGAAAAGNVDEAVADAVELALTVNEIGRPHDALAIIEAFREQAGQVSSPYLAWLDNAEGIAAAHAGQYERSLTAYTRMRQAGEQMEAGHDRDHLISTANQNLGMLHVERDPARAVQLLMAAARVKLQLDDYASALDIMMSAALAEDALGNVSEALRLLDFVVEQAVAAKDVRLMSAAYANRGGVHARSGDPAAAEPDFRAGLKAARKYNIGERVPMALLNMGSVMADSGRVGEAIRYYRRGIRAAQGVGSPVEEIRLRRALAVLLARRRRWRDADRELTAARKAAEALSDIGRAAQVDADSGVVQLMMGDFEQAARSLESAVSGLRQAGVPNTLTTALMNLASARRQLGQRDRADAAIRQALDAAATEDYALRAQIAQAGLGLWTDPPAYGSRAASYLRLRLDALRAAGDDQLVWESALGAAQLSDAGADEQAIAFFGEAIAEAGDGADLSVLWRIRNQRGVALTALGRYPEAIEDLEWCREAGVELDDRAVQLHALANLGEVERRADEHGRAIEHLEQAHRLARDMLDVESEMLTAGNLALALAETGRPDRAAQLYVHEAELAQRIGHVEREAAAAAGLAGLAFDDDPAQSAAGYEHAAGMLGDRDPAKLVEYLSNALLGWVAAPRRRRIQGAAQRLVNAAQRLGREDAAADVFVTCAVRLLEEGRRDEALSFHDTALRLMLVSSERFRTGANDLPDAPMPTAGPTPAVEDFDLTDVDEEDRAVIELVWVFARRAAPYLARIILDVHRNPDIAGDQNAYFAELAAAVAGDLGARDVIEELIDAARRGIEQHLADQE